MNPGNFFTELKRRNVYKVAVAYAVIGWVIAQIATQIFPFLEIPNWIVRLVIVMIAIGLRNFASTSRQLRVIFSFRSTG